MACLPQEVFLDQTLIDNFRCEICHRVAVNPIIDPCDHTFGLQCYNQLHPKPSECPISKKKYPIEWKPSTFTTFYNMVSKLTIRCPNANNCDWTGHVKLWQAHDQFECQSKIIKCPHALCNHLSARQSIKKHADECELRMVQCTSCFQEIEHINTSEHFLSCPEGQIPCPMSCGGFIKRSEADAHLAHQCSKMECRCPFSPVGCSVSSFRNEVENHLSTEAARSQHLLLIAKSMLSWRIDVKQSFKGVEQKLAAVENIISNITVNHQKEATIGSQVEALVMENQQLTARLTGFKHSISTAEKHSFGPSDPKQTSPKMKLGNTDQSTIYAEALKDLKSQLVVNEHSSVFNNNGLKDTGQEQIQNNNNRLMNKFPICDNSSILNLNVDFFDRSNHKSTSLSTNMLTQPVFWNPSAKLSSFVIESGVTVSSKNETGLVLVDKPLVPERQYQFKILKLGSVTLGMGICSKSFAVSKSFRINATENRGSYLLCQNGIVLSRDRGLISSEDPNSFFAINDVITISVNPELSLLTLQKENKDNHRSIPIKISKEELADFYVCAFLGRSNDSVQIIA